MARLSVMDAAFLQMESQQTPAHVGGLQIFEPPKGREKDFLQDLIVEFEKGGKVEQPFNQRLKEPTIKLLDPLPSWETDPEFDLNYHVRFAALPRPGNNDQLFTLVERLHARQLDRSRPLWELYCIEGLEGGRVAIYTKIHHALVDGVSGMKLMAAALSTDPDSKSGKAPWQVDTRRRADPDVPPPPAASLLSGVRNALETQLNTLPEIGRNFQSMIKQLAGQQDGDLAIPFTAPSTPFNTDVTQHRRFAVETLSVPEVKALGAVFGATVNDVVLAICSGALRSYLKQHSALPARPLISICP
ncbi:MAG: wax ester/triacylglycerol synthase domain-containing protein, partial [Alphaproteobacteria bacterium]